MSASTTTIVALGLGVLSAVLILAGGIVFFVVGRGRGALPGAGFVVLALGTVLGSLLATFAPMIIEEWEVPSPVFSAVYSVLQLLFDLVGWGLIIAAVIVLARSDPAPATAFPAAPGVRPGPPQGQAPPGYGAHPAPPGPGHAAPPSGAAGPPPPPTSH